MADRLSNAAETALANADLQSVCSPREIVPLGPVRQEGLRASDLRKRLRPRQDSNLRPRD